MFQRTLEKDSGLAISRCNSIHTFFMSFSIDVIFLDRCNRVTRILNELKPWRFSPVVFGADRVIEVKGGMAAAKKIRVGDELYFMINKK
ncbi:MAG: hypothetical protein BWY60_00405 [Actinobacteria bacterium ADurb.Bin346]|nr:MAG: hypothetical protein BWY60_00405 [Actinobacteria bacterium ADurb.Bin346]